VLLEVTAGPDAGLAFRLRQGQIADVGRTEWADFCIPGDAALADSHFTLHCEANGCRIVANEHVSDVLVNGEPVPDRMLRMGDRITAGETTFSVSYDGVVEWMNPELLSGADGESADSAEGEVEAAGPTASELCESLKLGEAARELLSDGQTAVEFYDALTGAALWQDAVRFLAAWLPKPKAVWWGCEGLLSVGEARLTPAQRSVLEAAQGWVLDPTDENRRATRSAAKAIKSRTPAGWLGMATFWADGSIGPPGTNVPAQPHLTAHAVAGAINTAAAWAPPADATRQKLLEQGRALVDADIAAPETSP